MMPRDTAETMALQALVWLMAQDTLFADFLGQSGASVGDMKQMAADPGFLAAVLDFILQDDETVVAASAALGLPGDRLLILRQALPGGEAPHWT
jgi:Protein of unknown function (DUF3572)